MTADRKPLVKLAELWQRTSAAGNIYYSGFPGGAQLLLFDDGEHAHPTRPDAGIVARSPGAQAPRPMGARIRTDRRASAEPWRESRMRRSTR
jgi:hypothetical protein